MFKKSLFLSILIFLAGTEVFADLPVGPVYLSHFPRIDVVIEPPGLEPAALRAIAAEDLELLEDGVATSQALEVRTFGSLDRALALVVAVDVSGTMTGEPLTELKKAVGVLVDEVRPQDRFALVTFADEFRLETGGFISDQQRLRQIIAGIEARGKITELFKALYKSLQLLEQPGLPQRKRLVVVSDGKDEGEAYTLEDVIGKAQELRVPVDSVGLTRIDPKYLSQLERLADLSGGSYDRASKASDLERRFDEAIERIDATPVATFEVERLTADDDLHRVGVRWRTGGRALEGESEVLLPSEPTAPRDPSSLPGAGGEPGEEPGDPGEEPGDGETEETRIPVWVFLAGGAVLLALVVLWLFLRRRKAAAAAKAESDRGVDGPDSPSRGDTVAEGDRSLTAPEPAGALAAGEPEEEPPPGPRPPRVTQFRIPFNPPAAGRPATILRGTEGGVGGVSVGIEDDPFWIGGDESNHLSIDGDDFVSSHHACIRFHQGSLLLYDHESTNGTFLNEEQLEETPRPLTPGDRVRCGRTVFVVLAPADGGASEGDGSGDD